jgi:nitrogen fixation protein NifU and related proteins
MYNTTLLDHFQNPRNVGELPLPAVTVEVTNPACGDVLRLSVAVVDGRVEQVRYQTRGCTASIAAGSALTELLTGRDRTALGRVDAKAVEDAVGGLSPESRHAAVLCADAVRALLKSLRW